MHHRTARRHRRRRLTAAALAGLVAVAACSSSATTVQVRTTAAATTTAATTTTTTTEVPTTVTTAPPSTTVIATVPVSPTSGVDTTTIEPVAPGTLVIAVDLPMQGASRDASQDTFAAARLVVQDAGGKAGRFPVALRSYDDSTAARGGWDDATCAKNAAAHVAHKDEIAVLGTYNSGCSKLEVPVLDADPSGPMLMISHANTNPGLTRAWDIGEPGRYYPTGRRNYGRIIATDDLQGAGVATYAAKSLGVKQCLVVTDGQTYGRGIAESFKAAATGLGIKVTGPVPWDPRMSSYTDLFRAHATAGLDCVFLGGIDDNNGEQLIRDKVAVLGPNTGKVKLLAPDGFTGYPTVQHLADAQGMYIAFAGLPASELVKRSPAAVAFLSRFVAEYGHEPVTTYALYGAAAMQLLLASIATSDGTRSGVVTNAFSGLTVPAAASLLGPAYGLDRTTGEATVRDVSIQILQDQQEQFAAAIQL